MRYDYAVFAPGGAWARCNTAREALRLQRIKGGTIRRKPADNGGAWDATTFIACSVLWGPVVDAFDVEYTDTFSGEANYSWVPAYSWVQRWTVYAPQGASDRAVMRAAKAAAGLSGVAGRTDSLGELQRFRPYGSCTVLFVSYHDGEPEGC